MCGTQVMKLPFCGAFVMVRGILSTRVGLKQILMGTVKTAFLACLAGYLEEKCCLVVLLQSCEQDIWNMKLMIILLDYLIMDSTLNFLS